MKTFLFQVLIISVSLFSCKSNKNRAGMENLNKTDADNQYKTEVIVVDSVPEIRLNPVAVDSLRYSLVVSFYSIGEGIDFIVYQEFELLIRQFEEDQKEKFIFQRYPWGREGEIDFCIRLEKMSEEKQKSFIAEAGKITSRTKLVHVNHNAECRHKGVH